MRRATRLLCPAVLAVVGMSVRLGMAFDLFTIAVPSNLASVEGNAALGYPLNIGFFNLSSQRYQQVYDASQFTLVPGGGYITAISFRVNGTLGPFTSTLPDVQLDLSTTPKPPGGLSLTFADNVGWDDTVVYRHGPLTLSGSGGAKPNPFDVTITLTTPFRYDPSQGNLLLDIRNFGGGQTVQFDATSQYGDTLSRVFTDVSGVDAAMADGASASGLVTQFTVEAPEPSTVALFALGLGALLRAGRRKAAVNGPPQGVRCGRA